MQQPSPVDLVTLAQARSWIFGQNPTATSDNATLQLLITSKSIDFLKRTGVGPQSSGIPASSPFNQAVTYTETYTGNGNDQIQLRNSPILSVSSVSILGNAVQSSTGPNNPGWFISDDGCFLGLRASTNQPIFGGYGLAGWSGIYSRGGPYSCNGWPKITDSIQVSYTAGYPAVPVAGELRTIPALPPTWAATAATTAGTTIFDGVNVQTCQSVVPSNGVGATGKTAPNWNTNPGGITGDGQVIWLNDGPPYALTTNHAPWQSDGGVVYFNGPHAGQALTAVTVAPSSQQYYLQGGGGYLFAAADAGLQVQISYSYAGTPTDIQEAILRWVNLIYKRRGWEGIRSLMQKDAGSTIYTGFEIDPSVQATIEHYRRRA
jgi:hypothetical protein